MEKITAFLLPQPVQTALQLLQAAGFEAYLVGGCVRDILLGEIPSDYDICTNALPREIMDAFAGYKSYTIGEKFGTITVVIQEFSMEITTFRTEGQYTDFRRPQSVCFTTSLEQDLKRRDFTVNAMAYNPQTGLVDPYNGVKDLQNKIIRCVGQACIRFEEDALRLLRAIRFAAVLDFSVEPHTQQALYEKAPLLQNIAPQRIRDELCKILCCQSPARGLMLLQDSLLPYMLPELTSSVHFPQSHPYHKYDVFQHIAYSVQNCEAAANALGLAAVYQANILLLRLTMLFHDAGKPEVHRPDENGVSHFPNHSQASACIAEKALRRLCFDKKIIKNCISLITLHRFKKTNKIYIKQTLSQIGPELFYLLLIVFGADALSKNFSQQEMKTILQVKSRFEDVLQNRECYNLKSLAITGDDVAKAGFYGSQIGEILEQALQWVIHEPENNVRSVLLQFIRQQKSILE